MCTWLLQVFITCFSFLATITISDVVLITISLDNEGKAYFIMAMSAAGLLFSMVKFCLKKRKMNHVEEEKLKYEVELAKVTKERQGIYMYSYLILTDLS